MYRTKKYGVVTCREENKILAELERDFEKKRKKKRRNKHEPTRRSQDTKPDNR